MCVLDWTGTIIIIIVTGFPCLIPCAHFRRIYFDNHQVAYYNDGINDQPRLLYDFGAIGKHMKIWAVLLYHAHVVSANDITCSAGEPLIVTPLKSTLPLNNELIACPRLVLL